VRVSETTIRMRAAVANSWDEDGLGVRLEHHRRELELHCLRLLGSRHDAEDVVQETFLRAWRAREQSDGPAGYRAWLYRIATNVCLDRLRVQRRRPPLLSLSTTGSERTLEWPSHAARPWMQASPDRLVRDDPEAAALRRETIEHACLTARQLLPPRQRAVFLARDVLGWTATETAQTLGLTPAAANSALQRARATIRRNGLRPLTPSPGVTPEDAATARRFLDACERDARDQAAAVVGAARDGPRDARSRGGPAGHDGVAA
jgi:RNA polymerase sigma-70 factor, ECF subfamily